MKTAGGLNAVSDREAIWATSPTITIKSVRFWTEVQYVLKLAEH